jgi:hypothetical protein
MSMSEHRAGGHAAGFGLWRGCLVGMALLASSGCGGEGLHRYRVSGSVRFEGKPVPVGEIYFEPDSRQGNTGPTGFAEIRDGRYDTAGNPPGKGAVAGAQQVRINGYGLPPKPTRDNPEPDGVVLFRDYSTTATLPAAASTQDFEVSPAARGRK